MNPYLNFRPDRRTAIKWMLTAAASTSLLGRRGWAEPTPPEAGSFPPVSATGYGTDPDMMKSYRPGELWPLTFTDTQRASAAALCAVIIPADGKSPSAAELGVHDFIDEWISAPYPDQARDRPIILNGLAWIEAESQRRFDRKFSELTAPEHTAICDDICFVERTNPPFVAAAKFFALFRDLTGGGFYTTPQGMNDLGYIGNTPLVTFEGPPPGVLKKLGLT